MERSGETIPADPSRQRGPSRHGSDAAAAIERLRSLQADTGGGGDLTAAVEATAVQLDVTPRTVWRWLAGGLPARRPGEAWEPSSQDIDAYVRWKANAAAAWRERSAIEADTPPLRTFQRGIARTLSAADRAVIVDGVAGRRRHQVYLLWEPSGRNQLWEADHKQLDIDVIYPRRTKPVRPWVTTFIDGYSLAVMGWAIDQYPSAATVLAALGEAIRVDRRRGPFGGVPQALRPDRGLEFVGEILTTTCTRLGVQLAPTRPYQPHLKGKIERLHLTFQTELLAGRRLRRRRDRRVDHLPQWQPAAGPPVVGRLSAATAVVGRRRFVGGPPRG